MANEIFIPYTTGQSVTVQLYQTTAISSPFSATEIGTTGNYVANMPGDIPFGQYFLAAFVSGVQISSGQINWDGAYEVDLGMATVQGLNHASPATTTPTSLVAGNINIVISGDQITNTVLTRT